MRPPVDWTIADTTSLLDAAFSGVHIPFALFDLSRDAIRCNREYLDLFQLTADDLRNRGVGAVDEAGARLIENEADERRFWLRPPEQQRRDVLRFRDGRVFERVITPCLRERRLLGLAATYRDLTASLLSQRQLATSRAMLERAQEVAHVGSWFRDHVSGALEWTAESQRIFGIRDGELPRTPEAFLALVHPDDREAMRGAIARLEETGAYDLEHRLIRPGGELVWVHERATVERDHAGRPVRTVGTIQDITTRRRLEEQLSQAQKLEALGRLAGGVAHDLNNALTAIVGYTELTISALSSGHPAAPDVLEIRRAAERAESVTRQLLSFSRQQPLQPRVFRLSETLSTLSRMLQGFLGTRTGLIIDVARDVEPVRGDPGQIEQAIVNLVVNSRDAMPDGGTITMHLGMATVGSASVSAHDTVPPGRYVELSVADTGTGMPGEVLAHIFEPFFTTKEPGKGTGLGLAMVYGTVKQIGGFLAVESTPGKGTVFHLFFPPAVADDARKGDVATVAALPDRSPVVVVAEDEAAVRTLVELSLSKRGYRVLVAASGLQALGILEQERHVDLLLTDANMPGMSGIDLVREAVGRRPGLRVIVMSGFTEDLPRLGELESQVLLLPKPFTPRELRERVDTLFGRS